MTLKELRRLMLDEGADMELFIAGDEEGNAFYALHQWGYERLNGKDVIILWPGGPRIEWEES